MLMCEAPELCHPPSTSPFLGAAPWLNTAPCSQQGGPRSRPASSPRPSAALTFLPPLAVMGVPAHTPLLNATDPLAAFVAWNGRVSCRGTGSFPEDTRGRARLLHS